MTNRYTTYTDKQNITTKRDRLYSCFHVFSLHLSLSLSLYHLSTSSSLYKTWVFERKGYSSRASTMPLLLCQVQVHNHLVIPFVLPFWLPVFSIIRQRLNIMLLILVIFFSTISYHLYHCLTPLHLSRVENSQISFKINPNKHQLNATVVAAKIGKFSIYKHLYSPAPPVPSIFRLHWLPLRHLYSRLPLDYSILILFIPHFVRFIKEKVDDDVD